MAMVDFNWIDKNGEILKDIKYVVYALLDSKVIKILISLDGQKLTRSEITERTELSSTTVYRLLNKLQRIGFISTQEHKLPEIYPLSGKGNKMTINRSAPNGEKLFSLNLQHIGDILFILNTSMIYESSNNPSERLILENHTNSSVENYMFDFSILIQLYADIKSVCTKMDLVLLKKFDDKKYTDTNLISHYVDVFYIQNGFKGKFSEKFSEIQPTVYTHLKNLAEIGFIKREVDGTGILNSIQSDKINMVIDLLKRLSSLTLKYPIESGRPLKLKLINTTANYPTILVKKTFKS